MKLGWLLGLALILADQSVKAWVLYTGLPSYPGHFYSSWVALFVLTGLLLAFKQRSSAGMIFILSGGISNILDMVLRHMVVDIIVLKNLAFNLADVEIAIGVVLILISSTRDNFRAK